MYCKIELDSSTGEVGAVLKTKYNIPFSEIMIYGETIYWGGIWQHITIARSVDSLHH